MSVETLNTFFDDKITFPEGLKFEFTSTSKDEPRPFSEKKIYKYILDIKDSIYELISFDEKIEILEIVKDNLATLNYNQLWKEKVEDRINFLTKIIYDEKDEINNISKESLEQFFHFFKFNSNIKKPDITLNNDGLIRSDWKIDNSHLLSITFFNNGSIKFLIFKPNPKYKNKINRMAGTDYIDSFITTIESNDINWIYDN